MKVSIACQLMILAPEELLLWLTSKNVHNKRSITNVYYERLLKLFLSTTANIVQKQLNVNVARFWLMLPVLS